MKKNIITMILFLCMVFGMAGVGGECISAAVREGAETSQSTLQTQEEILKRQQLRFSGKAIVKSQETAVRRI